MYVWLGEAAEVTESMLTNRSPLYDSCWAPAIEYNISLLVGHVVGKAFKRVTLHTPACAPGPDIATL